VPLVSICGVVNSIGQSRKSEVDTLLRPSRRGEPKAESERYAEGQSAVKDFDRRVKKKGSREDASESPYV
jgi:hypothetical protein